MGILRGQIGLLAFIAVFGLGIAAVAYRVRSGASPASSQVPHAPEGSSDPQVDSRPPQFRHQNFGNYSLWWDEIPSQLRQMASLNAGPSANIHPSDYIGPDACRNCHKKQYDSWSEHPHRWMNSRVSDIRIRGDFNNHRIPYLGGEVTFYRVDDSYRMRLERESVRKEYLIEQTIGSRFFQYYVGKQLIGPEAPGHPIYSEAHVLPLGYWIDRQEWVPTVHVGPELSEKERPDPYAARPPYNGNMDEYADLTLDLYRSQCNFCHTTFAIGDMFARFQRTFGLHVPVELHVSLGDYMKTARPEFWPAGKSPADLSEEEFGGILRSFHRLDAQEHAVTLGVSCEACHLGAKAHAKGQLKRPYFFPNGNEVVIRSPAPEYDFSRNHDNINWACGRCHAGQRPQYANGIATWNSTEYSDAMRGSCYSQLTCVRCHNPHESMGHEWSHTAAEDDAVCLSCHQKFEADEARQQHTHHPLNHEGSRCMNCHMPRINEGLQEVVRTHTIFSPTNRDMIEKNQMNACNQCHVDRPIDWTLSHLKDWYGTSFSQESIEKHYPQRQQPTAIGWLKSGNESVRLVAADSLARAGARWAIPELIDALDDPFLLNRQFARIGLERLLDVKLSSFGYSFFQTPDERARSVQKLKDLFANPTADQKEPLAH